VAGTSCHSEEDFLKLYDQLNKRSYQVKSSDDAFYGIDSLSVKISSFDGSVDPAFVRKNMSETFRKTFKILPEKKPLGEDARVLIMCDSVEGKVRIAVSLVQQGLALRSGMEKIVSTAFTIWEYDKMKPLAATPENFCIAVNMALDELSEIRGKASDRKVK